MTELTAELHTYKANNRIHEERQKLMEAERARLDKRFQEQLKDLNDQLAHSETTLGKQVYELKLKLRSTEEELTKSQLAKEKSDALAEQKTHLM